MEPEKHSIALNEIVLDEREEGRIKEGVCAVLVFNWGGTD
jgi:hypothetical protein